MQGKPDMYRIKSRMPADADTAFEWHNRPGALDRLLPPWEEVKILSREGGIKDGDKISLKISWGIFDFNWNLKHQDYQEGRQFCDVQENGPFKHWIHRHIFRPIEDSEFSTLKDAVDYRLPFGLLGRILGRKIMTKKLNRLFDYRHTITKKDLRLLKKYPNEKALKILIVGHGLVGQALKPFLTTQGHHVQILSRKKITPDAITWNPDKGMINPDDLEGIDVIVNLCGESINQRWGRSARKRILNSRVQSTQLLVDAIQKMEKKPQLLINASGAGYYGKQEGLLTEDAGIGSGFLASVCESWENEARKAESSGVRVVALRMGAVMTPKGGALKKILDIYNKGLGGKIGSGQQAFPWVSIEDVISAIYHCIKTDTIIGPVNLCSPQTLNNSEFNQILAERLRKMGWLRTPAILIYLIYGKMGKELLLTGSQVYPQKLLKSGFEFDYAELDRFLNLVLE